MVGNENKSNDKPVDLRDEDFIRYKLYEGDASPLQRYASLVLRHPSFVKLLVYEFLVTFIGPIPGALGLALRKLLYPHLFGSVGQGVVFGRSLTIRHPESIHLGDGVILDDYCLIDARGAGDKGIRIGAKVMINRGASIQAKFGEIDLAYGTSVGAGVSIISQGPIYIDQNVSIAGGSTIAGGRYVVAVDHHDPDAKKRQSQGTIRIGRNTRIGMHALIQDGVEIGQGVIVAPGSVVLNSVEDFAVVAGNPARPWRSRKGETTTGHADALDQAKPGNYEEIAQKIRTYLEETVFVEFGDDGLDDGDSFLAGGVLDSVGFVALTVWLSEKFAIVVMDDEMVPENLDSVKNIVSYINRKSNVEEAT